MSYNKDLLERRHLLFNNNNTASKMASSSSSSSAIQNKLHILYSKIRSLSNKRGLFTILANVAKCESHLDYDIQEHVNEIHPVQNMVFFFFPFSH